MPLGGVPPFPPTCCGCLSVLPRLTARRPCRKQAKHLVEAVEKNAAFVGRARDQVWLLLALMAP